MLWETRYRRWCRECDRYVLAHAKSLNAVGHAVLTLVTFGLWLPVAVLVAAWHGLWKPARCPNCGGGC